PFKNHWDSQLRKTTRIPNSSFFGQQARKRGSTRQTASPAHQGAIDPGPRFTPGPGDQFAFRSGPLPRSVEVCIRPCENGLKGQLGKALYVANPAPLCQ